ncbi:hypothetical protein [Thalassobius vesicularis]|uniref:hypothetical protein n=1 Tax=Thalassobius vesicularis TaxID=1294297 RepID=UPI001454B8EB|nr:hypothetical protein [Thalassobius vesicularis]
MFYEKIDPSQAQKLMPEFLQGAAGLPKNDASAEPGVLRLLRELTQSNIFTPTE